MAFQFLLQLDMKAFLRKLISPIMSSPTAPNSSPCGPIPSGPRCRGPKRIHWGYTQTITYSTLSALSSPRPLPGMSASYRKPILKRPSDLDREIMVKNMWNMISLADERLDRYYQFSHFVTKNMLVFSLSDAIKAEDNMIKELSNQRAWEACPKTGLKLRFRVGKPGNPEKKKRLRRRRN